MYIMLPNSVVWYCIDFIPLVLHGIALYGLVSYVIYIACFCVFRFVAWAVSRKTPIPLIYNFILFNVYFVYIAL